MTIEQRLIDVLGSLVSGRVYPDVAPAGATKPFITYQQVGGMPVNYTDGAVPDRTNSRFQLNVWAATRKQAAETGAAVETALREEIDLQTVVLTNRVAIFDQDTGERGTMQDFSLWL